MAKCTRPNKFFQADAPDATPKCHAAAAARV